MNESTVVLPRVAGIEELPMPEEVTEHVAPDPAVLGRKWNHGSTQTSDDMYLGGLMCE